MRKQLRKRYFVKLAGRILILAYLIYLYFMVPSEFDIILKWNMFDHLSPLHILYIIWILGMLEQLIPKSKNVPLGSHKLFLNRFKSVSDITDVLNEQKDKLKETVKDEVDRLSKINYKSLQEYVIKTTKKAYKVFALWAALMIVIGVLYFIKIIGHREIFMITAVFYVCDLICVLIWCPFRLILGNKCCTTCRIFNWDHAMMFLPLLYIPGLYTTSLLLMAIAVWLVWEVFMMIHPERFWEVTNISLRCSECTDKLCIQYCRKLR